MVLVVNEHSNDQTPVAGPAVIGEQMAVSGDYGRAVTGVRGRSIAGDEGCAISDERGYSRAGHHGYSLSGDGGRSISGDRGMSMTGVGGTVRSGVGGLLVINNVDGKGNRFTVAADIDEVKGPLPNVLYRLEGHTFVPIPLQGDIDFDLDLEGNAS